jgi:uncharacterized protein (DUF2267 family)
MLQTQNQNQAMLRSVLHNVRRRMTTEQVLTFADALPPLPRGICIEVGGQPIRHPSVRQTSFSKKLFKTCHRVTSRRIRS